MNRQSFYKHIVEHSQKFQNIRTTKLCLELSRHNYEYKQALIVLYLNYQLLIPSLADIFWLSEETLAETMNVIGPLEILQRF